MPLSEYEQRVLEEMEQQLRGESPKLASSFEQAPVQHATRTVNWTLAVIGTLVGFIVLVVAMMQSLPWLGIIGFAIAFAAIAFAVRGDSSPSDRSQPEPPNSPTFDRLAERWDRRQDQD